MKLGFPGLSSKQTTGRFRVRLLGIEVEQHPPHAGDVLGVLILGMHHMSFCQGLRWSSRPSVDGRSHATDCQAVGQLDHQRRPAAPASSGRDLRGGLEQAVAIRRASSLPVSLRSKPARGSSFRAASRLPSTKRRLVL